MRILYLSRNVNNYKSANYQKEFLNALSKLSSLFIYGPGYEYFDNKKTVIDIVNFYGPFDIIFVGHYWLFDGNQRNIDPWPQSGLSKISLKKFIFLNKEYANLEKKLNWIKKNKFDCIFSHHHECKKWKKKINKPFKYFPFAYDDKYFTFSSIKRKYDIAFSGALQNKRGSKVQSDVRLRILNRLFYTLFDIPIIKRKKYRHLSIYWNSIPTTFIGYVLSKILKKYEFLNVKKYAEIQKKTKLYINCKSPLNLISPRYFENIASGCMVVTEKNSFLKKLIPKSSYVEFYNDLSNFDQLISDSLKIFDSSKKKREVAAKIIQKNHNWNVRAKNTLKIIKTFTDAN
jgi:spore maturation protein CgeB